MKYNRYVMKYDTDTFDMVSNIVQGKSPIIKEILCSCPVITLTIDMIIIVVSVDQKYQFHYLILVNFRFFLFFL